MSELVRTINKTILDIYISNHAGNQAKEEKGKFNLGNHSKLPSHAMLEASRDDSS